MNNRKWNSKNPNQGKFERVLCVCSAGLLRSPTVAAIMSATGKYNTRAAGLEADFALIPVDEVLLSWADTVIVMDHKQERKIKEMGFEGKMYNFLLPDSFEFMDPDLVKLVKFRLDTLDAYEV